jgi:transcriptional regulator with XRE-family HTH domain
MHIGNRIKEVMKEKHMSAIAIAKIINCERTNIYNIFERESISSGLLVKFCHILKHDFFKDLSADTFKKN